MTWRERARERCVDRLGERQLKGHCSSKEKKMGNFACNADILTCSCNLLRPEYQKVYLSSADANWPTTVKITRDLRTRQSNP